MLSIGRMSQHKADVNQRDKRTFTIDLPVLAHSKHHMAKCNIFKTMIIYYR